MSSSVGRNDPCPCGSGKKHKRCCGANSSFVGSALSGGAEPAPGYRRAHEVWPKTREALTKHAVTWLGTTRLAAGFAASPFVQLPERARLDWYEMLQTWQSYEWVPVGERETVAAHWLATRSPKDAEVADLVRRASAQPVSFFQLQASDPGRGVLLRDLLSGAETFVVDRSLSESLPPWSVMVGRLLPLEKLTIFDAVGPHVFSPDWAEPIVRNVEDLLGPAPWSADTLRGAGSELLELYVDLVLEDQQRRARPPVLHNSDGDLLVMCTETWRLLPGKRADAIERLGKLGLEAAPASGSATASFAWHRDNDDGVSGTVLGHVNVDAETVILETNSKKRRARMKPRITKALIEVAVHSGSVEQSQKELLKRAASGAHAEPAAPPMNGPEAAVLRADAQSHYATWPDEKLPALNGRTPREAITTPAGKAQVAALLRDMEHQSHSTPMAGAYDFNLLRRQLGLPH